MSVDHTKINATYDNLVHLADELVREAQRVSRNLNETEQEILLQYLREYNDDSAILDALANTI